MTRERALERIRKLLALAAPGSGAAEEEARTAAVQAARLMSEHGLVPGGGPSASAIDLGEVTALALRVVTLERLLADREKRIREDNRLWRLVVEEERAEAREQAKTVATSAARRERENLARSGGKARAGKLDRERRVEIARAGAEARWRRWRERRGVQPR